MIILGLHSAVAWDGNNSDDWSRIHDAGATLFINGRHHRSISEERLSRIKYDGDFAERSIDYVLGGISKEDVNIVAYSPSAVHLCNMHSMDKKISAFLKNMFPNAEIWFVGHHLAHAMSAVVTSPFKQGSYLTLDGMGSAQWDFAAGMTKGYENHSIGTFDLDKKNLINHTMKSGSGENSFGDFYMNLACYVYKMALSTKTVDDKFHYSSKKDLTKVLQFSAEGKIMGLSAYGKPSTKNTPYTFSTEIAPQMMGIDTYEFGPPWINFHKYNEVIEHIKDLSSEDAAYYVQNHFEEAIVKWITSLRQEGYLSENVCFAGGCFLNVCANTLLRPLFKNIWIPPFTNDTGVHFGAAAWASMRCNEELQMPTNVAFLGKTYDDFIPDGEKECFEDFDLLCEVVAKKIKDENAIIGWFQGRSEHGPRALGSRSILMSPCKLENKDIMNSRVKHREYWRPFAGVIQEHLVKDYFKEGFSTPYMLFSQHVKTDKLPAITHEDGTCRIQTVNRDQNERLYSLLEKVEHGCLLNTSFNDNGEPIVEEPMDAILAFRNMDIDYLVIGNYLIWN